MQVKHCINCMEEIEGEFCSSCGYNQNSSDVQPQTALKCNTVLHGRYLVGRVLGQGGFGITYIGFDLLLNIKVAIKEYFPLGAVSRDNQTSNLLHWHSSSGREEQWKDGCESFLKEARKMAKIDSITGIVRVRDTFYENQTSYIVMDFIEGITLKQFLLSNGPMNYAQCIQMLSPLMNSLCRVHQNGLIHRDISPDNIMIHNDESLKLLDLGAAKDISVNKEGVSQLVTKRGFSPAEQYMESGSVGAWTDVYAFCATMYYCIYGKVIPDAMERVMQDSLTFPVTPLGETLPEDVARTLKDGLAVREEDRIRSMDELLARLAAYVNIGNSEILATVDTYSRTAQTKTGKEDRKKRNRKLKKRKMKPLKIIIPAAVLCVCAIAAVALAVLKPWRITVERMGNSNSNILNDGGFLMLENEYEYYIDHNKNLHVCKYDADAGYFYVNESVIVAEDAAYINEGKDGIYFAQSVDGDASLCKMNYDGTGIEVLYDNLPSVVLVQYVLLSNDKEYLYFISREEDGSNATLQRYDIGADKMEPVKNRDMCWYNLYGDSMYYTVYSKDGIDLYKCDLKGKHEKKLDSNMYYTYGFVENNSMFLYSLKEKTVIVTDLEGVQKSALYEAKMDINNFTFAYGNGWIYYVGADDGYLYHIREDGTANDAILEGRYVISICYESEELFLMEGTYDDDGTVRLLRAYLVYKDGTGILELDEADLFVTAEGLTYKQDGESIVICGYQGDKKDVAIPYTINGMPVVDIETDNLPVGYNYYLYAAEDELEYVETGDKTGVVITGYTGDSTYLMLPDSIGGVPVIAIGESAFRDSGIKKIALGKDIREIGDYAFSGCGALTYVAWSDNLTKLGMCAFEECGLSEIELPQGLTEIGSYCFYDTGVEHVFIPASVSRIGVRAFTNMSVDGILVNADNEYYKVVDGILYSKDMTVLVSCPAAKKGSFIIPATVRTIAEYAFAECNELTDIAVADGSVLETISEDAFYFCDGLTRLDLRNGGTEIQSEAIYYCENLMELYLPYGLSYVPADACKLCSSLWRVLYSKDCDCQMVFGENVQIEYYEDHNISDFQ